MSSHPAKKPKDRVLFASLIKGHKADAIIVSAEGARLNYPGSPVWQPTENVAPILIMLMASLVGMFVIGVVVGIALIVLSALIYVFLIRPWILNRVSQRAVAPAATANQHNWDLLWKKGGLSVVLKGTASSRCTSPAGDWHAFVMCYLPQVNLDGTEVYKDFARAEDDEAGLKKKAKEDELYM